MRTRKNKHKKRVYREPRYEPYGYVKDKLLLGLIGGGLFALYCLAKWIYECIFK